MSGRYERFSRNEGPFRVMLLKQILEDVPNPDLPYLVTARWDYEPEQQGFPSSEDYGAAQKIEDYLTEKWAPSVGAVYAGHLFGAGRQESYFYVPKALDGPVQVKLSVFKKISLPLDCHLDSNWKTYTDTLTPTPFEARAASNELLLMKLKSHGDKAEIPRKVDFNAYFPSAEARAKFHEAILERGFTLGSSGDDSPGALPFRCEFHYQTAIDIDVILQLTEWLWEVADGLGGEYDGWATPVVRG